MRFPKTCLRNPRDHKDHKQGLGNRVGWNLEGDSTYQYPRLSSISLGSLERERRKKKEKNKTMQEDGALGIASKTPVRAPGPRRGQHGPSGISKKSTHTVTHAHRTQRRHFARQQQAALACAARDTRGWKAGIGKREDTAEEEEVSPWGQCP